MKEGLFFSIIIPTYNRADKIIRTIESVFTLDYSNFELIVVDDGSTDNTEDVVSKITDSRFHYYKIENGERAAARNFGMKKSKGDYVTFLDSDDLLYPFYLSEANKCLSEIDFPVFFHLAYEIINETTGQKNKIDTLINDDVVTLAKGNPLSCMGVFIKKDAILKHQFNENRLLSGTEDWEFWLRLFANFGLKVGNRVSAALIQHEDRSVLSYDHYKLQKRKDLALESAFQDEKVKEVFGKYYNLMDAYFDTYISLHLAMSKNFKSAFELLIKAIKKYPAIIFERRTLAIIKKLILR